MDAETLTALEESIAHWERIRDGKEAELGTANCALCQTFYDVRCIGCPVREASRRSSCDDTPYVHWDTLMRRKYKYCERRIAETPDEVAAAQAELDFLRSLLPKELGGKP